MKDSIAYLPKDKQEELNFLVTEILRRLPQTEFIILYGSYARGNYVRRSIRIEDGGIPTVKISDYDIYVITSGINSKKAETVLDNVEDIFFAGKDFDRDTPVEFINDDIKMLNKYLEEGRYFYTQIKQEGIILYNSGNHKLARRRKLNFAEIKEQAQAYLDEKYDRKNKKRRVDRRNEEGLTKREQDKKDRIEKIKVFLSKGLNQSKIAQELGISRQAVSKLCKEI